MRTSAINLPDLLRVGEFVDVREELTARVIGAGSLAMLLVLSEHEAVVSPIEVHVRIHLGHTGFWQTETFHQLYISVGTDFGRIIKTQHLYSIWYR